MPQSQCVNTILLKYLSALTGFGLVVFLFIHLFGNLRLYSADPNTFNLYSDSLLQFGIWLKLAEIGLLAIALIHVIVGMRLALLRRNARPIEYAIQKSKGGPSKYGFSSVHLLITGLIILVFVIIHIWQFKYGPGVREGYIAANAGRSVRDLHRLVVEVFHNPYWMFFYIVCMCFLGIHLKHGIWSLFQSLGLTSLQTTQWVYRAGMFLAYTLAVVFASIPVWIYLSR